MEPWGVPSGGDWGLYRGGALFFEGTEGCSVRHCSFVRVDNNALFLSGYNRDTLFADNEFVWLGLSAMAGWGYTDEMDGTDGQQPRFTRIERNYVHEIGIVSTALTATAPLCSSCADPLGQDFSVSRVRWQSAALCSVPRLLLAAGRSRSRARCGSKRKPGKIVMLSRSVLLLSR